MMEQSALIDQLPDWVNSLRPHQWDAVNEIIEAFENTDLVWLDGPTGTGKTLIAEAVRIIMAKKALYVCSSKSLQDQFARDFSYAKVLKGRSNYPTLSKPFPEYTTADCDKEHLDGGGIDQESCSWCPWVADCHYESAKLDAAMSPLAVLNTSYFLTECNKVNKPVFTGRGLVIVDECDELEKELMGFVEFAVADRTLKKLGIVAPKKGVHKATIIKWLKEELLSAINVSLSELPFTADDRRKKEQTRLKHLADDVKWIAEEIDNDNWVRDNDAGPLVMKPVRVDDYGKSHLWRHGKKWLCMSATIISPDELANSLGWKDDFEVVRVPMTFPVENRKIYVAPLANMANKESVVEWPKMERGVARIVARHPDERILIHTVSYKLASVLVRQLRAECRGREVFTYAKADERERALRDYRATPGAILVASSFARGIDLKGEDCRVVIVAKVPFPYLGDSQVSQRLHSDGGGNWYSVQTARTLVQMTGRGVRSKDDWCVTYILDKQFLSNVWRRNKGLLPKWWQEAVDMSFPVRELVG